MSIKKFSVETMVAQFEKRMEWQIENQKPRSKQLMTECMLSYYRKVHDAQKEGKSLAFTSVLFYPELVNSMGLTTFPIDQFCIQMLASGRGVEYIDKGISFGFCAEACSPHIATVGMAADGIFPRPDLMYSTAQGPCDSAAMLAEALNHIYKCPIFWLSMPYGFDDEAIAYFKEELWDMVAFTEKHTGLQYNEDKLREMLEIAKVCDEYFDMVHAFRKNIPTPIRGRESFSSLGPRMTSEGQPLVVEFMEALYAEIKERVDKGIAAIPEERHRIVVQGAPPFWCMGLYDWIEEEFKAVPVVDLFNAITREPIGDTADPMAALSRKALRSGLTGGSLFSPYPPFAEMIAQKAIEHKADSSIFFTHFGCKQSCGRYRVVTDALRDIAGIPSAIVDVDIGNPAVVSEARMKEQIAQYFRTLDEKKSIFAVPTLKEAEAKEAVTLTDIEEDREAGTTIVF